MKRHRHKETHAKSNDQYRVDKQVGDSVDRFSIFFTESEKRGRNPPNEGIVQERVGTDIDKDNVFPQLCPPERVIRIAGRLWHQDDTRAFYVEEMAVRLVICDVMLVLPARN